MAVSTSVSAAVAQAVSFMTRPLIQSYPAATIGKLQLVLEANLTAYYTPTWAPHDPLSGSGRRCITLNHDCLPPRVVYSACLAAGVQWFDWINLLGVQEFDLFVDPGYVYIRVGTGVFNVWTPESATPLAKTYDSKTAAQQLLESDLDAGIFDLIADEMSAPTWMTPITSRFPAQRAPSPLSTLSSHSRCSSRSSNSSSGFSMSSIDSDSSASSTPTSVSSKQSRKEKVKTTRVFVDTSKTVVTPYDGGKTTVLTGGVMLGGGPSAPKRNVRAPSGNWRMAAQL